MLSRSYRLIRVHLELRLKSHHGLYVIWSHNYSTFVPHDRCPSACGWAAGHSTWDFSVLECNIEGGSDRTHRLQTSMHDACQFHGLGTHMCSPDFGDAQANCLWGPNPPARVSLVQQSSHSIGNDIT